jgi:uncharacterized membrane protein HdeD (DUF308 family)
MTQTRHVGSGDTPLATGSSWIWMLLFGIATVILGLLALSWPGKTIAVIALLFGIQLCFAS